MTTDTYSKLEHTLFLWIKRKSDYDGTYTRLFDVLEFGKGIHTGFRKDGVTPEFQHQIEIALYLTTIVSRLQHGARTLEAAILHDTVEDYGVDILQFDTRTVQAVVALDKTGKSTEQYYTEISQNPIASIVKGADRMHNLQTMVGVFTPDKQWKYITETRGYVLPMLHEAEWKFNSQADAYQNIRHILNSQIMLIEHSLK